MSQELLQRIAENITPIKTKSDFSVNFSSTVPVNEIALAKSRTYNSWFNIRSKPFGDQQPNNSLVFAWRAREDGTPDWNVVSIPTGSYQIEKINEEFQRRTKSITGENESKIAITVHEPTLSSSIEIKSPDYVVDIYQSSIRTVLGWPEVPRKKSDYITTEENYHGHDPLILTWNNSPDGTGRHIAPHNVNITTVIALNLACDINEGSYQIDLGRSNQAQQ